MRQYLLNALEVDDFTLIVTLTNYETEITDIIRAIKIPSCKNHKILIDTALNSGMNKYRFISAECNNQGHIELITYEYVDVSSEINIIANNILKNKPDYIKNSILTMSQKKSLINFIV